MKLALKVLSSLLSALAISGIWFLHQIPAVSVEFPQAQIQEVATQAKPLELFCPGPLVQVGGKDGTDLGSMELVGSATLTHLVGTGVLGTEPESKFESGQLIQMASAEQTTNALVAIQTQLVDQGRMAGLSGSICDQPSSEGWLVGGLAGPGFESVLLVANPNQVEVQVQLKFSLPTKEVPMVLTLAPMSETQVSLASAVEAEPIFAVGFASSGPKISVALQNRASSGLSATGVELRTSDVPAHQKQVIPGFELLAAGLSDARLRLFNPGDAVTSVDVAFIGSATHSDAVRVELEANSFAEVSPELPAGEYLVIVDSKEPILATLYNPYVAQGVDFAWLGAAEGLSGKNTFAIPNYDAKVAVANASDQAITVRLTQASGTQEINLPARSQKMLRVGGSKLELESKGEYFANLSIYSPKGYAVINPRQNANLGTDLSIRVR